MKRFPPLPVLLLVPALLFGCADGDHANHDGDQSEHTPTAQADPAVAEWQVLFDGTTTDHWRGYKRDDLPGNWGIEDSTLAFTPGGDDGGDIISKDQFENFELALEWKISEGGNSGIFFNVVEGDEYGAVYETGPEMQVLDDAAHADGDIEKHRAGDLYDLISCSEVTVRAPGEWNEVRIVLNNGHLEQWLNGTKVVETEMWTEEWDAMVAGSKFNEMPGFGKARSGHLALQDHGDKVWYRNIKVRAL